MDCQNYAANFSATKMHPGTYESTPTQFMSSQSHLTRFGAGRNLPGVKRK